MDELIYLFNGLMSGSLPTKELETEHFIVTVSANPAKLKKENKQTHAVWRVGDLNDTELALLAIIIVEEGL